MVGGLRRISLLVATLVVLILVPPAKGAPPTDAVVPAPPPNVPCTTLLGCGDDLTWAENLERRIVDNFFDGQIYEIEYATPQRVLGERVEAHAFGDSALWTGTYLAAQSFRYSLAKKKLDDPLTHAQRPYWMAQKAEAKSRIDDMVRKFHVLANISGSWNHELQPSPQQTGFGGGVFNGEPGLLMRACIPVGTDRRFMWNDLGSDPTGMPEPYTKNRRVFGPLSFEGTEYFCEDGTSRDAYAGTTFGLLTAFDLVGPDDPALREQVRNDIVTMANFAHKYYWNTPRPHGRISIPFGTNQNGSPCKEMNMVLRICGHDFENFISPLFIITPWARLNLAQGAYHVTRAAPGHADTAKWEAVYAEEFQNTGPFAPIAQQFDQMQPYDAYYKHNLDHLIGYNLMRNVPSAEAQELYMETMAIMDSTTRRHLNAHFETITYALTGDTTRLTDAVDHLREWRDYRTKIEAGGHFDHRPRCSTGLKCVPEDQVEMRVTPEAPPVTIPGPEATAAELTSGVTGEGAKQRAYAPLPIADRVPADFLWQRTPNQLEAKTTNTHQAPGIDYLLPYWMIRYYTEGTSPIGATMTPWAGPTFN